MHTSSIDLDAAVAALGRGDIVCIPTETTYGLAVDAGNAEATGRLAKLKGRRLDAPFAVIAPDLDAAKTLARAWPAKAENLARRFWPGPLTLVLPAREGLPPELVGSGGGVGVRISSHPIAAALAQAFGRSITATSANPTAKPAATTITQARTYFATGVSIYLDAGPSSTTTPSTIIAVGETGHTKLLREGAIPREQLDL